MHQVLLIILNGKIIFCREGGKKQIMEPRPKGADFNRSLAQQPELIDPRLRELLEKLEIDPHWRQRVMRQQIENIAEGGSGIVFVDLSED